MTEAAVLDGGAPAPAEPVGAPITAPVDVPNALGTQTPVAEKPEAVIDDKPKTAGDAVRKAMEAVKAKEAAKAAAEAAPKDEPKPAAKAEAPATEPKPVAERAPDGKFAPKPAAEPAPDAPQPATTHHEAPARFDAAAKAEWANAPESVRGAVQRTIRELETGIEEHRARWEPIKQYDDMARQYGTDLPAALERYVAMDKALSQDLATGLDGIIRDKTGGQIGLREFVAQLTGQQPDQAQSRADATIHELRQQIGQLQQQIGGVTGTIRQQVERSTKEQVQAFSADKPHFEALAPQIAEHIRAGKDLQTAYDTAVSEAQELARSLGFAPPAEANPQPLRPAPPPPPLKPAGQKSVSGAPASGSDPASTRNAPAPSIREALKRASARAG